MELKNEILEDAKKCFDCKLKPCSNKGCPLGNDIPKIIKLLINNDMEKAYNTLLQTNILGSICGRICPHYKQCMGSCIRGLKGESVEIGNIEAYVSDYGLRHNLLSKIPKTSKLKNKKIAVIGGGPSGLTCSYFLAKEGANVVIYEKNNKLGGILSHGIPEFRLDRTILEKTIDSILSLGIDVIYNKELGIHFTLNDLINKYDAVFLAIGANVPEKMDIEGENLSGVYGANALLEKNLHPNYIGKNIAVIGGGNVAMDAARTVKKMGAKNVYVIYRRSEEQMPAEKKEVELAKKEGIEFIFKSNIRKILGKDKVQEIECIKTKLVKRENDKRLYPIDIVGSNYKLKVDYVIMAIGSKPDSKIIKDFKTDKYGYIEVNEKMQTSISTVYAGGDITGETATVAWAAKDGRTVAENIIKEL